MASKESARLRTADQFIQIFTTLDVTPFYTILSDDYIHTFGPNSVTGFGPYDKAGFINHVSGISKIMTTFPVESVETIDSESSNAVRTWTKSDAHFKPELMGDEKWKYNGQNMFMFWFNDEGKIKRCEETVDSKKTYDELLPLMGKARAALAKLVDERTT